MVIDTTRGLTDIKMPYEAPVTLKEVTPYILGVMLIGAIIFLILWQLRKRIEIPGLIFAIYLMFNGLDDEQGFTSVDKATNWSVEMISYPDV